MTNLDADGTFFYTPPVRLLHRRNRPHPLPGNCMTTFPTFWREVPYNRLAGTTMSIQGGESRMVSIQRLLKTILLLGDFDQVIPAAETATYGC